MISRGRRKAIVSEARFVFGQIIDEWHRQGLLESDSFDEDLQPISEEDLRVFSQEMARCQSRAIPKPRRRKGAMSG